MASMMYCHLFNCPAWKHIFVFYCLKLTGGSALCGDKPGFTKKQADLFFPPDFTDDFPVAMQISQRYGLIYVITKLGLLFAYDLETATAVYRNRISLDPMFFTVDASTVGGFYAINRRGQVLLATVNKSSIIPFVTGQLNNLELAVILAKRGNLPKAENLREAFTREPNANDIYNKEFRKIDALDALEGEQPTSRMRGKPVSTHAESLGLQLEKYYDATIAEGSDDSIANT